MKTLIAKSTATAVLLACMMNAFAVTGNMQKLGVAELENRPVEKRGHWLDGALARRDGGDAPRGGERGDAGDDRQQRRIGEERQRYVSDQESFAPDESRRNRMTPEERRALRRQINEAGRDIYGPGR